MFIPMVITVITFTQINIELKCHVNLGGTAATVSAHLVPLKVLFVVKMIEILTIITKKYL
jgi:hypothetical protein